MTVNYQNITTLTFMLTSIKYYGIIILERKLKGCNKDDKKISKRDNTNDNNSLSNVTDCIGY